MITSISGQSEGLWRAYPKVVTIEIRRKCFVVRNAGKGLEADLFNHELAFGEELASEAFE